MNGWMDEWIGWLDGQDGMDGMDWMDWMGLKTSVSITVVLLSGLESVSVSVSVLILVLNSVQVNNTHCFF